MAGYLPYGLFLITLAILVIARLIIGHSLSPKEIGLQLAISLLVIFGVFQMGENEQVGDTKLVNTVVASKEARTKSCPSGWVYSTDDHCTHYRTRQKKTGESCTTTNGRRSCTPTYTTQYNYTYDSETRYFVHTEMESKFEISRVDGPGKKTPPRYARIIKGEPAVVSVSYVNYIRGAKDSVLHQKVLNPREIPYPEIYDYYRADRVIAGPGWAPEPAQQFSQELAWANAFIRETKANIIVYLTMGSMDEDSILAEAWEAHNINDIVITIGTSANGKDIQWVKTRSWSANSMVNVTLDSEIKALGVLDFPKINAIIQTSVLELYKPRSMEEFEYLATSIPPPIWVIIVAALFLLLATPAMVWFFHKHEVL